jgi:coenzyme F420-dependent glucose-6-phosphate dehydrogenase
LWQVEKILMLRLGYKLSSEEFGPLDLVQQAARAEIAGFDFALISDHFHPWSDRQGQSPFVWAALGAIARATERLMVGTGVTCPIIRTHPAIVAHAAATVAAMMPGRFFLGVGTGENLNEHVTGAKWPSVDVRREMLREAVEIIRLLWAGGVRSYRGTHHTLESARLYTLPPKTVGASALPSLGAS